MSSASCTVREARLADLDRLVEIETRAFSGDLLSRRALRYLITRAQAITLVAVVQAEAQVAEPVVGYIVVLLRRGSDAGRIYSLAVDPDWRGRQIGGILLEQAEERLRRERRHRIRLEVRSDNEAALRRYHGAGYEVVGSEPGYYEDGETALKMEKDLRMKE